MARGEAALGARDLRIYLSFDPNIPVKSDEEARICTHFSLSRFLSLSVGVYVCM